MNTPTLTVDIADFSYLLASRSVSGMVHHCYNYSGNAVKLTRNAQVLTVEKMRFSFVIGLSYETIRYSTQYDAKDFPENLWYILDAKVEHEAVGENPGLVSGKFGFETRYMLYYKTNTVILWTQDPAGMANHSLKWLESYLPQAKGANLIVPVFHWDSLPQKISEHLAHARQYTR